MDDPMIQSGGGERDGDDDDFSTDCMLLARIWRTKSRSKLQRNDKSSLLLPSCLSCHRLMSLSFILAFTQAFPFDVAILRCLRNCAAPNPVLSFSSISCCFQLIKLNAGPLMELDLLRTAGACHFGLAPRALESVLCFGMAITGAGGGGGGGSGTAGLRKCSTNWLFNIKCAGGGLLGGAGHLGCIAIFLSESEYLVRTDKPVHVFVMRGASS